MVPEILTLRGEYLYTNETCQVLKSKIYIYIILSSYKIMPSSNLMITEIYFFDIQN